MSDQQWESTQVIRAPETEGPLLTVEDLITHFRTPRGVARAVDGVTFTLERGKTLGIVGESGSGKTVLSRSIMGLIEGPNVIRTGKVLFEGREVTSGAAMRDAWGNDMAMIFQDPMTALNPVMRVGKQITESLRTNLDMDKSEANETAVSLLRSVGIPSPEKRVRSYPHELSGGMRQRVMIAIALACGPKLLFADEPTTALDVTVQAQILDLLADLQQERFMSVILVTHDLGVVAGRADEIMVMYAGRVVEKASAHTLFSDMRHPYTHALLRSIPKLTDASHTRLEAIAGRPPDIVNPPKGCKFAPRCRFAQERCMTEEPPLSEGASAGHVYRCFFPVTDAHSSETPSEVTVEVGSQGEGV